MTITHQKTIEQSRAWLIKAFFDQLTIRPYDAITVSSIAEQAQLSRRTFYRHFKASAG
jgi:AcrR family transcriptional regulator